MAVKVLSLKEWVERWFPSNRKESKLQDQSAKPSGKEVPHIDSFVRGAFTIIRGLEYLPSKSLNLTTVKTELSSLIARLFLLIVNDKDPIVVYKKTNKSIILLEIVEKENYVIDEKLEEITSISDRDINLVSYTLPLSLSPYQYAFLVPDYSTLSDFWTAFSDFYRMSSLSLINPTDSQIDRDAKKAESFLKKVNKVFLGSTIVDTAKVERIGHDLQGLFIKNSEMVLKLLLESKFGVSLLTDENMDYFCLTYVLPVLYYITDWIFYTGMGVKLNFEPKQLCINTPNLQVNNDFKREQTLKLKNESNPNEA